MSAPLKRQPLLSVVVLCYKSEDLALSFYSRLKRSLLKHVPNHEIVLVGNYWDRSSDRTPEILEEIARKDRRVTTVIKKKQGMMGWDMRSGLRAASGKFVAVIDGDDQFKPELVLKVFKKIATGEYDFVKTKRVQRDDGFYRSFISFFFNLFFDFLFGAQGFSDVNSKPKIMTKSALQKMKLEDDGWFIDAEIMIQTKKLGLAIGEVDVRFHKNKHRDSFVGYNAIIEMATKLVNHRLTEWRTSLYAIVDRSIWVYWQKIAATSSR